MMTADEAGAKTAQDIKSKPGVLRCCKQVGALITVQERPDRFVSVCKVCKSRHYRMLADPGIIKFFGSPTGKD
jgi:hypothetical protein